MLFFFNHPKKRTWTDPLGWLGCPFTPSPSVPPVHPRCRRVWAAAVRSGAQYLRTVLGDARSEVVALVKCLEDQGCRFVPWKNMFGSKQSHIWYQSGSKYWCFTRVWRLDSGPNLQPWVSSQLILYIWNQGSIVTWYIANWELGSKYIRNWKVKVYDLTGIVGWV